MLIIIFSLKTVFDSNLTPFIIIMLLVCLTVSLCSKLLLHKSVSPVFCLVQEWHNVTERACVRVQVYPQKCAQTKFWQLSEFIKKTIRVALDLV